MISPTHVASVPVLMMTVCGRRSRGQFGQHCSGEGSCGTVVWAALQAAKELGPDKKCLCILADGIRNYLSKFVDDDWMKKNNFKLD